MSTLPVYATAVEWDARGDGDMGWVDWYYADDKVPSDWDGSAPDRCVPVVRLSDAEAALAGLRAECDALREALREVFSLGDQLVRDIYGAEFATRARAALDDARRERG